MALLLDLAGSKFTQSIVSDSQYSRRYCSDNLAGATAIDYIIAGLASLPATGSVLSATPPLDILFLTARNIDRVECDKDNPGQGVIYGTLDYATVDETQASNPDPDDDGTPISTSGTSLEQIRTWTDIFGNAILVPPPAAQAGQATQAQSVLFDAPTSIRTFQRLESTDPQLRNELFAGTVNALTWNVAGKSSVAPGFAKCNKVTGSTDNGGASFTVNYEFAITKKAGGWQPEAAWIDPETGLPDPSSSIGDGIVNSSQYPLADFNSLNL